MKESFRSSLLGLFGIMGFVATLIGTLEPLVTLARWVRYATLNWLQWTRYFWQMLLEWSGIKLSIFASTTLTIMLFYAVIVLSCSIVSTKAYIAYRKYMEQLVFRERNPSTGELGKLERKFGLAKAVAMHEAGSSLASFLLLLLSHTLILFCFFGRIVLAPKGRFDYNTIDVIVCVAFMVFVIWSFFVRIDPECYRRKLIGTVVVFLSIIALNFVSLAGQQLLDWINHVPG